MCVRSPISVNQNKWLNSPKRCTTLQLAIKIKDQHRGSHLMDFVHQGNLWLKWRTSSAYKLTKIRSSESSPSAIIADKCFLAGSPHLPRHHAGISKYCPHLFQAYCRVNWNSWTLVRTSKQRRVDSQGSVQIQSRGGVCHEFEQRFRGLYTGLDYEQFLPLIR